MPCLPFLHCSRHQRRKTDSLVIRTLNKILTPTFYYLSPWLGPVILQQLVFLKEVQPPELHYLSQGGWQKTWLHHPSVPGEKTLKPLGSQLRNPTCQPSKLSWKLFQITVPGLHLPQFREAAFSFIHL